MLDQSLKLPCGAVVANRIVKAAMTEGLADENDCSSEELCTLYGQWSDGGAGLLITGNVMIDRRFLERPGNVVIDNNGGLEELRTWAAEGTRNGNHLWMQISHPGRQCNRQASARPLAPSEVRLNLGPMFGRPVAMTETDILDAIERYARVAAIASECGFSGVQIHAAHGYLISQFLSPRVNRRSDQWGGSLENRARFLLQTVAAVRERLGDQFPISVKLNSSDFQKGGFSDSDCRQVAIWLDQAGIDLLEISGGTYEQPQLFGHSGISGNAEPPKRESTRQREAYFLDYARNIQDAVTMPLMVTGGFRSLAAMTAAVANGEADLIGLARPLCVDLDLPRRLTEGTVDAAERYEQRLNLGHGFFGPTSPLLMFKIINIQGEVAWFYRQIVRVSKGLQPNRGLGMMRALWQHMINEWRLAKRRTYRP